jgi:formate dehydrogenase maturation protein FdhE
MKKFKIWLTIEEEEHHSNRRVAEEFLIDEFDTRNEAEWFTSRLDTISGYVHVNTDVETGKVTTEFEDPEMCPECGSPVQGGSWNMEGIVTQNLDCTDCNWSGVATYNLTNIKTKGD